MKSQKPAPSGLFHWLSVLLHPILFYSLLAMNIAHYETIYGGSLPLQDGIAMTYTTDLSEDQNELVTRGMETMAGVLGSVIQGLDEKIEH